MTLESYFTQTAPDRSGTSAQADAASASTAGLEELIGEKSSVLGKKLDILAAEIIWRLHIAARNLKTLQDDKLRLTEMLQHLNHAALYHLREHQEKAPLYRALFSLETETRAQHVECWRDVVLVMRDFLTAWEAHELARSRAIFIQNVGTRTQRYL
jgi:hypothetical protein